jgi:multisubunit Na+/H+ antiporter MnhC subunit
MADTGSGRGQGGVHRCGGNAPSPLPLALVVTTVCVCLCVSECVCVCVCMRACMRAYAAFCNASPSRMGW